MTGSATWDSWRSARERSRFPMNRWEKFEEFLKDMGEKPCGMRLDVMDSGKPFGPGNARWSVEGKRVTGTIADLARTSGVKYHTMYKRLKKKGETLERALRPVREWKRRDVQETLKLISEVKERRAKRVDAGLTPGTVKPETQAEMAASAVIGDI